MPFQFKQLEIPGPVLVESRVFNDERGYFLEGYKRSDFVENGITCEFLQDNHSFSRRDALRGLHYQVPPVAQGKLVKVVRGCIWDVVVDVRRRSPYFLKWVAVELSDQNHHMLYVPPGFAHGFATLSDDVSLFYKCSTQYSPKHERGIRWDDPQIGIPWPIENPVISSRDAQLPLLKDAEIFEEEF